MWHLYYNPESGDISVLNKKKVDLELPYLRIDDDVAEKFINHEHRYVDWQVIKKSSKYTLVRKENKTEPIWFKRFSMVPAGIDADVILFRHENQITWKTKKAVKLTVWITEWNNPLNFIGSLSIPDDHDLLVPLDQKISIFTAKNNFSICYYDKNLSC
jgi:hypothetical protein